MSGARHCRPLDFGNAQAGLLVIPPRGSPVDCRRRRHSMCDYSLEHVASRPATVADRLVTTTFANTITRGFAAADDVNTAVCLRPGTEIAFERDVFLEHPVTYAVTCLPTKVARFRQIDLHMPHVHHDALEFATGEIVP